MSNLKFTKECDHSKKVKNQVQTWVPAQRHTGTTEGGTYGNDGRVGHMETTVLLNLRGLWPQFSAMRSEQILQRRMSRIHRGMTHAAIPRPCPLTSHRFPIDYQSIRAAYYRRTSPISANTADNSWGSAARKLIRSFVRGCSKLSFHEWRKTLSSLKGNGLEGA